MTTRIVMVLTVVSFWGEGDVHAQDPWTAEERSKGYLVFEHSTMQNLAQDYVPEPHAVVQHVSCSMAQNEYESIQLGVHSLVSDLTSLQVRVETDLNVTIYHRIDPDIKEQLGAFDPKEGEISSWTPSELHLQQGNEFAQLPVGESVNFWLTFYADSDTIEGVYRGKIHVQPANQPETVLDLSILVRPFKLQPPRISFGAWMREDMLPKRFGGVATSNQTILAIYRDMAEHGHNSCWFHPVGSFAHLPPRNNHWLDKLMPLAQAADLLDPHVPSLMVGAISGDQNIEQREAAAAWLQVECRRRGWPEIIVFGPDEPRYPHDDNKVQKALSPLRGLPVRVNLDQSSVAGVYGYSTSGLCDLHNVMDGCISPEMIAELKRGGAEIWTYSFRLWREGFIPLRQRYFAGLYTWVHRLGGNWIWAYHHGHHRHAWFAPDSQEPMPVTAWENRREGIDDYRYLQMVEQCVAAQPDNPFAIEAMKWLVGLRSRLASVIPQRVVESDPLTSDQFNEIRTKAAKYIQMLGPVPIDSVNRLEPAHAKDEAAPYRGRSVTECIDGLASSTMSERRSAAWALFELGPKAAPAVEPLSQLLDVPELRMPSLHALEAIGADSYSAVAQIAELLEHPDFFVRTGAVLTLGQIGCPLDKRDRTGRRLPSMHADVVVAPLLVALGDVFEPLAYDAAEMLSALQALAEPAVPKAIIMLDDPSHRIRSAAMGLITGLGPLASAAVPKLIEVYKNNSGDSRTLDALASIGPPAAAAIPMLEESVVQQARSSGQATAHFALFCIRGDVSDLRQLLDLLNNPEVNAGTKKYAVKLLNRLGAKAGMVENEIRQMLAAGTLADLQGDLKSFLSKVNQGKIPGTRFKW